ncbi:MAG TPA: ribose 5-phosphate isomerase B [Anaerolineae bacterium]|nr:ribose 5-phosphate isomerase B [Anaerolineae bacterium]
MGSDHAGFSLKQEVVAWLEAQGYEVSDLGIDSLESVDYPDFARPVAEAVAAGKADRGILICGTGIGMSMTANKVPGIRAALCTDPYMARMSRLHNDANVLCMGGRVVGVGLALDIVETWLATEFEGGRHARRVGKIMQMEGCDERTYAV